MLDECPVFARRLSLEAGLCLKTARAEDKSHTTLLRRARPVHPVHIVGGPHRGRPRPRPRPASYPSHGRAAAPEARSAHRERWGWPGEAHRRRNGHRDRRPAAEVGPFAEPLIGTRRANFAGWLRLRTSGIPSAVNSRRSVRWRENRSSGIIEPQLTRSRTPAEAITAWPSARRLCAALPSVPSWSRSRSDYPTRWTSASRPTQAAVARTGPDSHCSGRL